MWKYILPYMLLSLGCVHNHTIYSGAVEVLCPWPPKTASIEERTEAKKKCMKLIEEVCNHRSYIVLYEGRTHTDKIIVVSCEIDSPVFEGDVAK